MEPLTYDEMVDEGVKLVISAFGKGEDLHGAMAMFVSGVSNWTQQNIKDAALAEMARRAMVKKK